MPIEGFPQIPKRNDKPKDEAGSELTRRDLLRGAGAVAAGFAGSAAVIGTLAYNEKSPNIEPIERKYQSEGTITRKVVIPEHHSMIERREVNGIKPTAYMIYVHVDGKDGTIEVSKDVFDRFSKDQRIKVHYEYVKGFPDILINEISSEE